MGAADVVPGVSGGTIAFITGIYNELLNSISQLKPSALKTWKDKGFNAFWESINGNFLLFLTAGIVTSLISLSKVISYLLHYYPIWVWAFFFGLIVASIIYIGKQIQSWNKEAFVGLILGTLFVIGVSMIPPSASSDNFLYLFMAGFLASTAMILPGISGSFILLILGSYSLIINAIGDISTHPKEALTILGPTILGVIAGLLLMSKFLAYLLERFTNFMMALLTGFLIGSLQKVWPWKKTLEVFDKSSQENVSFSEYTQGKFQSISAYLSNVSETNAPELKVLKEENISPMDYAHLNFDTSSQLMPAIISFIVGFSLIFIIEYLAKEKDV